MPAVGQGLQLLKGVWDGSMRRVKAALVAGANLNGSPGQSLAPILAATMVDHAGMVEYFLRQGADPDTPNIKSHPTIVVGERALHIAARNGNVEIVRLLLKRSRADPNATDSTGCTPLFITCRRSSHVGVEAIVGLLLEAGADLALADNHGLTPLHALVFSGHTNMIDMMCGGTTAPSTLNRCSTRGDTPLFVACATGQESIVSKLLSLGARQRMPLNASRMCPLVKAVEEGFVGVVRVLITEGGIRAVGGDMALGQALGVAVQAREVKILRLLLTAEGEERRVWWANTHLGSKRLLHYGAGYCCPNAVSILLEAGANEAAFDTEWRIPRDVIGVDLSRNGEPQMDRWKEVAIRRMLQRGPAYRARSWAWPSDAEKADGGSGGDDNAAAAAAAAAVLSSPPAVKALAVIGVRIFRPKEKSSSKFFASLVGRYCAKD